MKINKISLSIIVSLYKAERIPKNNPKIKTNHIDYDKITITAEGLPKDSKGKSAIVVIYIVDYIKLMNQDEKKAIDILHYKHKIILPFIEKYGGCLIKRIGDGTLCVFSDSAKDVCFSLEILQMWKEISQTKLKIGIHQVGIHQVGTFKVGSCQLGIP